MATPSTLLAWEMPRSLAGCSPSGHKKLDMTEQLNTHILAPTEPDIPELGKIRTTNEEMRLGISELV